MQDGYAFGTKQRLQREGEQKQNALSQLASQAYGAAPDQQAGILSQMAAIDPGAARTQQEAFQGDEDRRNKTMLNMARMLTTAPAELKPGLYTSMVPTLRTFGLSELPEAYTPETAGVIDQAAQSLVQAWNGDGATEGRVVGNALVNPVTGEVMYQGQEKPQNATFQVDNEGRGWWLRPGENPIPADMGAASAGSDPAQQMFGDSQGDLSSYVGGLISPLGGRITSTTGGQHNPGSKHYSGGAIDIGMGRESPERQAQILAALQSDPSLLVRDERTRPAGQEVWSGPHLHVERRGVQAQRGGINFAKPSAERAPPSGYQWGPDGSLRMIPGGPAQVAADARADAAAARRAAEDLKAGQKAQAAEARQVEAATSANDLITAIDTLTTSPGFKSLGTYVGDVALNTPFIRGDTKDAQAQLRNISGQVAIATMNRMKALSAQGATGFGALSQQELKLLQNSLAALDSENISNAELARSLNVIKDKMEKVANWRPSRPADNQQPAGGVDDLLSKYGIR